MKRFNPDRELYKIQYGSRNKIIFGVIALLLIISIGSTYALYQVRYSKRIIYTKVVPFSNNKDINILAIYVDGKKQDGLPVNVGYQYTLDHIDCKNNETGYTTATWDVIKGGLVLFSKGVNSCDLYFKQQQEINFPYVGERIQEYIIPYDGIYKLEVWGAQGGALLSNQNEAGGVGGYAVGEVSLKKNQKLYIAVGGQGETFLTNDSGKLRLKGGYNGGGSGLDYSQLGLGGGGATHIATETGLLSELETIKDSILIVAGGGGGNGGMPDNAFGGHGGGIRGGDGVNTVDNTRYYGSGGSQDKIGICPIDEKNGNCGGFGIGGSYNLDIGGSGGGGGYYGGTNSDRGHAGAGGGSGYIGNDLLSNKAMYCYQCTTSNDEKTKTISVNDISDEAISMYAKRGNGYARITYLGNE